MKAIRMIRSTSIRTFLGIAFASALTTGSAFAQKVSYYHLDALGNVRIITDATGNAIERHDYLPFGEECTTGPCASNPGVANSQPVHFTGKERDKETGLDYFGARYYRGNVGRFTTVDPVISFQVAMLDPQRWNRYAYSRNNPLRWVDPDGRQSAPFCPPCAASVEYERTELLAGRMTADQLAANNLKGAKMMGEQAAIMLLTDGLGEVFLGGEVLSEVARGGLRLTEGALGTGAPIVEGGGAVVGATTAGGEVTQGIYEFPDQKAGGVPYVGQSGNIPQRLGRHEAAGRLTSGTESTTEVLGGKTAREVAEHRRIQQITGGVPARQSSAVSNKVDPIGPARQDLLKDQ